MRRGRIVPLEVILLSGEGNRVVARGVVPIDVDEGAPPVICRDGDTFLRIAGLAAYQKIRVLHAGANFEAVP